MLTFVFLFILSSNIVEADYKVHSVEDFSWEANVKGRMELYEKKGVSSFFAGQIQTVAQEELMHVTSQETRVRARLRNTAYNLRVTGEWKNYSMGISHWSFHQADGWNKEKIKDFNSVELSWESTNLMIHAYAPTWAVAVIQSGHYKMNFITLFITASEEVRVNSLFIRGETGVIVWDKIKILVGAEGGNVFSVLYGLAPDRTSVYLGIGLQ